MKTPSRPIAPAAFRIRSLPALGVTLITAFVVLEALGSHAGETKGVGPPQRTPSADAAELDAGLEEHLGESAAVAGGAGAKSSPDAGRELAARRKRVEAEAAALPGHPWAGTYYHGDGLGVNVRLSIAPLAGFAATWDGCMGRYDLNYGTVGEAGGRLRLTFEHENRPGAFPGFAEELAVIPWGERVYLVASDELVEFCNAVNAGDEPRRGGHGGFLARDGDGDRKVSGAPGVPESHRKYLLPRPVTARITEILESTTKREDGLQVRTTRVRLEAGGDAGLLPGHELRSVGPGTYLRARIQEVAPSSSIAVVEELTGAEEELPPLAERELATRDVTSYERCRENDES